MEADPGITGWLRSLGLVQYEAAFRDNAIDLETLPELGEADLEKLGVLLGHRKRMLRAIAALSANGPTTAAPGGAPPIPAPPSGQAEPVSPRPDSAERRQLTVLFCDIVASTALATRLDPEDLREVLAAYSARTSEVVKSFGGFIARFLGDGILVYFGYPQAHEDDPEQALSAALALVDGIGRLDIPSGRLQVRIGVATGLVVIGDLAESGVGLEHEVVGDTPNLAARLQALAEPNAILVSPTTRQLVGDLFEFRDCGEERLKGFPEPVQVWQLVGQSRHGSRFEALRASALTPIVGREEELALLSRRWQQAKTGDGQIVLICGEPGIGKSRTLAAFEAELRDEPHLRLRCFCTPHHQNSTLYPAIAQLERAAGFVHGDPPETKFAKLTAMLSQSGQPSAETVALFAELMDLPDGDRTPIAGLDAQRKRELTLAALVRQLEQQTRQKPVVLIFEDVHWIDATSLELLDLIAARAPRLAALVCITFRPEFQPPWTGQPHVTSLALNRLYQRDAAMIVTRIAGNKPLPGDVLNRIMERADGIPLFVEELTKALLEGGEVREQDGRYVLDEPFRPLAIPSSLQALLMARLDRLSPVKELAQTGAALGRSFSYDLLAATARRSDRELREALENLAAAGLVLLRGVPPNTVITFKHALFQDAAYGTLLRSQRQELHSRIAAVLKQRFPEILTTQPEIVAHHYTQAGLIEPAIEYWGRAGERALRRSANVEGVRHLTRALELLASLPAGSERDRREFRLRLVLGPAMRALKGNAADEVWEVFTRARDLLDGAASVKERIIVLHGLWSVHNMRGELVAAHTLGQQCLALAAGGADRDAPAMANLLLGHNLWGMGRFTEARGYLERTLPYCGAGKEHQPELRFSYNLGVAGTMFLALALWPLGHLEEAADAAERARQQAHGTGHVPLIALVSYCGAFLKGLLGADAASAQAAADETLAYCAEHGVSAYGPWARFCQGAALAQRGDPHRGIAIMREALASADLARIGFLRPIQLGHLATATTLAGEPEIGLELLKEALQTARETEERSFEAELHRLRGEALLAAGSDDEGEAELLRALQVAESQQARLWQLRAAASVARLWRGRGKTSAARDLLRPICAWFSEQPDTADLTAARSLLASAA